MLRQIGSIFRSSQRVIPLLQIPRASYAAGMTQNTATNKKAMYNPTEYHEQATEKVETYQPPQPSEQARGAEHPKGVKFEAKRDKKGSKEKPIVDEVKEDIAEGNTTKNPLKKEASQKKQKDADTKVGERFESRMDAERQKSMQEKSQLDSKTKEKQELNKPADGYEYDKRAPGSQNRNETDTDHPPSFTGASQKNRGQEQRGAGYQQTRRYSTTPVTRTYSNEGWEGARGGSQHNDQSPPHESNGQVWAAALGVLGVGAFFVVNRAHDQKLNDIRHHHEMQREEAMQRHAADRKEWEQRKREYENLMAYEKARHENHIEDLKERSLLQSFDYLQSHPSRRDYDDGKSDRNSRGGSGFDPSSFEDNDALAHE